MIWTFEQGELGFKTWKIKYFKTVLLFQNGKQKHVKVGKDGTVYQEVYYTKEAPSNRFSAVLYALVDKTKKKKKATNDEA